MKKNIVCFLAISFFVAGCSKPPNTNIPGIPEFHPANAFFETSITTLVGDKECREREGDPSIMMPEIEAGKKYKKTDDLLPGVLRFTKTSTGEKYIGVAYMVWHKKAPKESKVCGWKVK